MQITPRSFGTTYLATGRLLRMLSICLVWGIVLPAVAQTGRAPVPDAAKQRAIAKLLGETYELDKLDSTSKKQQAVKKLLETTTDESLSLDERYVVLTTLIKLAQGVSDFTAWREAVERLGTTFDIDAGKETSRHLKAYLESTTTSAAFKAKVVEEVADIIQQAARDNRYVDAESLLTAADEVAGRIKASAAIKQTLTKARDSVAERRTAWKQFQSAKTKLAASADDPAANLTAGRWQAVYESNWPAATMLLVKSRDAKWKVAAELEQKAPQASAEQVVVGDAWWDLAQAETGSSKTALMIHAGSWYDRATPGLNSAVQKLLITKRLTEIASLKSVASAKAEVAAKPGTANAGQQASEWVDLLEWADGMNWLPRGQDWNYHLAGSPSAKGITIKAGPKSRFPLPAIIDGDYELEVEFTRNSGVDSVAVFFPVGIHTMHFECSALNGTVGCVHWIDGVDGRSMPGNGTGRRPSPVANGVRHRLLIRVTRTEDQAEFHIDLDNEKDYIRWKGLESSLTNMEAGDWRLTMVRHPWIGGADSEIRFHKVRARMLSGTLRRDVITQADREADLKEGFVRLVGQSAINPKVGWADFLVNQLPWQLAPGQIEQYWPLVSREPSFSQDYFGAHAPSRCQIKIPPVARSFSVIGYNQMSRTTKYQVLIDGNKVYDSGVTGIAVVKVDIPPGSSELELIVNDAGDGGYDHSYWCSPRFHTVSHDKITDALLFSKTSVLKFGISVLEVLGGSKSTPNQPLAGIPSAAPLQYADAIPCDEFLFAHADSSVTYKVPPVMARFSAIGYSALSNHVKFEVWADGRRLHVSPQAGIVPIRVNLPPGTKTIDLKVDSLGEWPNDCSMWCYPRFYKK